MFLKRQRRSRRTGIVNAIGPKLLKELITILMKVVGETVKDRILRAVLLGVLATVGQYASSDSDSDQQQPFVTQQKAPE